MPKKIVITTTGQPSTNPRMVKEYEALKEEGYDVKVFYSFWADWANAADQTFFSDNRLNQDDFILVGGSPSYQRWLYYYTRLRSKICTVLNLALQEYALSRTAFLLEKAALKEKADLYIAHNLGALSAAVKAAKKYKAKVGFDVEDYHRGEYSDQNSPGGQLTKYVEDKYLPQCDYITAASPLICREYKNLYPFQNFTVINNVFSKKHLQKINKEGGTLKLFWFSQTIGPHRGLETVVKAIELLKDKCTIELFLMGTVSSGYASDLLRLTTEKDTIHFLPPVAPHKVFEHATKFDVGLSLEVPYSKNRDYCLTNKLFTYLLAGNCIVLSNTSAQKDFVNSYPNVGYIFKADNAIELANILKRLYSNRQELYDKKHNSLVLASTCLNWENESEKFKLLIKEQLN